MERTLESTMRGPEGTAVCGVCGAPAIAVAGACVFCRSPLDALGEQAPLLDYLARHLPGAEVSRGVLGRGRIRQLRLAVGGQEFSAQAHRGVLALRPELQLEAWVDELVRSLTEASRSDPAMRRTLSRSGWAWR